MPILVDNDNIASLLFGGDMAVKAFYDGDEVFGLQGDPMVIEHVFSFINNGDPKHKHEGYDFTVYEHYSRSAILVRCSPEVTGVTASLSAGAGFNLSGVMSLGGGRYLVLMQGGGDTNIPHHGTLTLQAVGTDFSLVLHGYNELNDENTSYLVGPYGAPIDYVELPCGEHQGYGIQYYWQAASSSNNVPAGIDEGGYYRLNQKGGKVRVLETTLTSVFDGVEVNDSGMMTIADFQRSFIFPTAAVNFSENHTDLFRISLLGQKVSSNYMYNFVLFVQYPKDYICTGENDSVKWGYGSRYGIVKFENDEITSFYKATVSIRGQVEEHTFVMKSSLSTDYDYYILDENGNRVSGTDYSDTLIQFRVTGTGKHLVKIIRVPKNQ